MASRKTTAERCCRVRGSVLVSAWSRFTTVSTGWNTRISASAATDVAATLTSVRERLFCPNALCIQLYAVFLGVGVGLEMDALFLCSF